MKKQSNCDTLLTVYNVHCTCLRFDLPLFQLQSDLLKYTIFPFKKKLVHDDARAPVGAGDNDENDDINDYDNYGVVQTGLFGQQAGRQVYKCTGDISGALVYRAGANAGLLLSLPLFLSASYCCCSRSRTI